MYIICRELIVYLYSSLIYFQALDTTNLLPYNQLSKERIRASNVLKLE